MNLTRLQKTVLQMYWRYHNDGWRLSPFLRVVWWRWLLGFVYAAVGSWFVAQASSWASGLLVGLCAGAFLRDVSRLVQSYRTWPVVEDITNWQRVEELVQSHERTPA